MRASGLKSRIASTTALTESDVGSGIVSAITEYETAACSSGAVSAASAPDCGLERKRSVTMSGLRAPSSASMAGTR
eukprot:scaffold87467_cov33-Tisochrysis_lutea.AAC.3